jgi:translation initiation factor 2 alpha subunit (eIF-2alpha)
MPLCKKKLFKQLLTMLNDLEAASKSEDATPDKVKKQYAKKLTNTIDEYVRSATVTVSGQTSDGKTLTATGTLS